MKLANKKLFSLGLGGLLVFSMVGCGSSSQKQSSITPSQSPAETTAPATTEKVQETVEVKEVEKPAKIKLMVDGTFLDQASGQDAVVAKYKELTGIDLEVITIDHNAYNDQLALTFTSGDLPDVVVLSADYYVAYANQGALADITKYWEESSVKASGRIHEQYIDSLYIDGSLYGFSAQRGNGCLTYLRQDWLDHLGLSVPTTYDEYINVLRAFTNDDPDGNGVKDTYGVTAAGIIGTGAPFTNYLPEFWQDGYPGFYQEEDGTWVDGFTEPAMADALQRLKDAYAEGLIDTEITTNKTSSCRDKFYAGNVGAFTYWAGKWNRGLEDNTQAINPNAELVAIPPIKELGAYVERNSPVLAITNKCENPEGVFKYLFEFMMDGGEGQLLFTYGAEGVHYEVKEGKYTQLPDPENPKNTTTSIYIDPLLSIADWEDPFADQRDSDVITSNDLFFSNSYIAPKVISNDVMANYGSTLLDIRMITVADVVTGDMTVADGIASYKQQADTMVQEILTSLNK